MPPSSKTLLANWTFPAVFHGGFRRRRRTGTSSRVLMSCLPQSQRPLRYAVIGAGFAGLSLSYHLLKHSPEELHLRIDVYDEAGVGGGASGVSGGLLHPYSPKVKLLWQAAECWKECLKLLNVAEAALGSEEASSEVGDSCRTFSNSVVRRRGILRPATNIKTLNLLIDNAQNCLSSCRIEALDKGAAQNLVPDICIPLNTAFYMPDAVIIHPQHYLQGLFLACKDLAKESASGFGDRAKESASGFGDREFHLHQKSISNLLELKGEYDAVIVCVGAKADMIPELSGKLPLRTCRGVIAGMQLPENIIEDYPESGPSILSDAWLAVEGSRSLLIGSTWEWKSRNSSPNVGADEASKALDELLPKASAVYPGIKSWCFTGARAGLRAMPPLTPNGSLPLLGCIDHLIGENSSCKYWLFGGLGSRGLLYHGWLGKLLAQAVLSCNEHAIPSELTSWKNVDR